MRAVSSTIQNILDRRYGETRDVIEIDIKAQPDLGLSATTLYFANGLGVTADGKTYDDKIRAIGVMKFSIGAAPDNTEVTLENVSLSMGYTLSDIRYVLDGAVVRIYRAFKLDNGSYELLPLFFGQVVDQKVNQDAIVLTIVSDMSKRGTSVAGRVVTQRCIFKFNANGNAAGGESCGWTTAQPGNATTCDKDLDSTNGCKAHGNTHRFGGVPAFTVINPNVTGYDSDGGGHWSGGTWCVHPLTFILCQSSLGRFWTRAHKIKEGDEVVSINKFGQMITTKITKISHGTTDTLVSIMTEKGYGLSCSPSHPIITSLHDLDDGTQVSLLKKGSEVLVSGFNDTKPQIDKISSYEIIDSKEPVIIFGLEEPNHIYIAGNNTNGGIASHNAKPN